MNKSLVEKPVPLRAVKIEIGQAPKAPSPGSMPKKKKHKTSVLSWGKFFFLLAVIVPTALVGFYYKQYASDQFRSEMRFAVRGTESGAASTLGFLTLPGGATMASDAYVVIDYIHSKQLVVDLRTKLGIDLRHLYAKSEIDPLYRVEKDVPTDEFMRYWNWMVDADFNSTTGITTFVVTAFSAEDANTISNAVLKLASELVNDLSTEARRLLIDTAQSEVTRTEERLIKSRVSVSELRNRQQSLSPAMKAESEQELIQGVDKSLIDLKARRATLAASLSESSPSVRALDRQIAALNTELRSKRRSIGSGSDTGDGTPNLSSAIIEFEKLTLEKEFAEKAYTSALTSLESSQAEARKRARYFAIVVAPTTQEVALYPIGWLNTLLFFAAATILWLFLYLMLQSVRDHNI
jgi:capsular polysaccharide transport system permease protein